MAARSWRWRSIASRSKRVLTRHQSTSTKLPGDILPCQRHLFDIPDDIHWFNNAYLSPGLKTQYEQGLKGFDRKLHPWTVTPPDDFFTDVDEFRQLIATLLHNKATAKDISINTSVSYGMAVIGKHLDTKINDYLTQRNRALNIIVLRDQFPSNYYVWQQLCRKYGDDKLEIKIVDRAHTLCSWTQSVIDAIDENTVLVTVPNVHWSDGSLVDIEQINDHILSNGYKPQCHFVLDVTQSLGVKPFPETLDAVDYVCGALYKWLLGPYSMGFMYVAPQHQENEPLEFGWMTRDNSRMFAEIAKYTENYGDGAQRYDMGQRAQLQLMPMTLAGLRQIVEWDPRNIYDTLSYHNNNLAARMKEIGLNVASAEHRSGHMFGIQFDSQKISGEEILNEMKKHQFYLSIRAGSIRISPHLFCTQQEYDKFVEVIETVVSHKLK